MQTRRLRLGDVVDDYCPRERRLSNHVVVAMVDDAIKQTRCTTCDFEHPYKDGKLPARRKKKDATSVLYQQVLEGMTEKPPSAPPHLAAAVDDKPVVDESPSPVAAAAPASLRPAPTHLRSRAKTKAAGAAAGAASAAAPASAVASSVIASPSPAPANGEARHSAHTAHAASAMAAAHDAAAAASTDAVDGSVDGAVGDAVGGETGSENEPLHRRTLIRATLPRPVGEVPVRQAPTFTIREAARAPKFRRPFARNARPQGGQNGVGAAGPMARPGARGQQQRGKKSGGAQQPGAHRFGQGQGQGHGSGGGHHAKGRQGNQGNKRFK